MLIHVRLKGEPSGPLYEAAEEMTMHESSLFIETREETSVQWDYEKIDKVMIQTDDGQYGFDIIPTMVDR